VSECLQLPHDYSPAADLLADRLILVTGAAAGLGRAAARAFAAHGASVVLLDKALPEVENLYEEIVAGGGPQPLILPLDLGAADQEAYARVASAIAARHGHLDGLLHNAAELGALCPIEHYANENWMRILQVNLTAAFLLTRALLPALRQAPRASVLFTSDTVGRRARAYWGAYAVSKFATEGLMQVLADELEVNTRVRVNSLDPGAVRSRLRARAYPGEDSGALREPEQLCDAYVYLMSDDASAIRGQALTIGIQPENGKRSPPAGCSGRRDLDAG